MFYIIVSLLFFKDHIYFFFYMPNFQMWGSVVVWNPSTCLNGSKIETVRHKISSEVSFHF